MTFRILSFCAFFITAVSLSGCGTRDGGEASDNLQGEVKADGSSTVYPITEAVAEEFRVEQPDVQVTVGVSGTGGGFNKFSRGEIDINNASRPIKEQEAAKCEYFLDDDFAGAFHSSGLSKCSFSCWTYCAGATNWANFSVCSWYSSSVSGMYPTSGTSDEAFSR